MERLHSFCLTQGLQRRGFSTVSLGDYAISRSLRILPLLILSGFIYAMPLREGSGLGFVWRQLKR